MSLLETAAFLISAFVIGGVVLLVAFAALGIEQAKNMFRAGDKLTSAFFGFNGYATLSAECGRLAVTEGPTWPAAIIDFIFGKGHCLKAALQEKLLPEPR